MKVTPYIAVTLSLCALQPMRSFAQDSQHGCTSVSSLAESIMKKRQEGVSMAKMMEVAEGSKIADLLESLVIAAYDQPRYGGQEMQQRTIGDFRDNAFLQCIKTAKGR